jgi:hypothetical protein
MNGGARMWGWAAGLIVLLLGAGLAYHFLHTREPNYEDEHAAPLSADVEQQVRDFCGHCHAYPPPSSFPRWAWKREVEQGYHFFAESGLSLKPPSQAAAIKYFQDRAPEELPPAKIEYATTPCPVTFDRSTTPLLGNTAPAVSNVNLVRLSDPDRLDILACDMRSNQVMTLRPYDAKPQWRVLAELPHPAHVEVVDLDGDGIKDLLVANLGSYPPTDRLCGSVVWLRGKGDGTYEPITLLKDVGRVADVRAADFRGTGKLDLVVGVFGWQRVGEILLLENYTTDWKKPDFRQRVLDRRHGTIHVPVVEKGFNNSGKPDFVALISQEHETVVAFINQGGGKFQPQEIYSANNPGYGSSGIELVDFNGDGKVDVLYTNGDILDMPHLLKPYHGIQWLENRGTFPFTHHAIAPMYGVHRAVAADLCGNGRMDVLAVSFLPAKEFPLREKNKLDAVILLEQTASGKFLRHSLSTGDCDCVSCAVGDISGQGRKDLVMGSYGAPPGTPPVIIWRNKGLTKR